MATSSARQHAASGIATQIRRGAKVTLWHAYNVPENRWIGRDVFTLGSIKRLLVSLGYCAKEADCRLKRERS